MNLFQNWYLLEEESKLICLILQQRQILKMQLELIQQNLLKMVVLANLKSDVDKLGIGKLKDVPINWSNLKSKVDKLDVDKLVHV